MPQPLPTRSSRSILAVVCASALAAVVFACGSSTSASSGFPDGSTPSDAGAAAETSGGDGSCSIFASDYDDSCTTDSDCTFVPFGGNVCDTCSNRTGCLVCDFAALSKTGASTFDQARLAALGSKVGDPNECATGSCPSTGASPVCRGGRCAVDWNASTRGVDGGDAGLGTNPYCP